MTVIYSTSLGIITVNDVISVDRRGNTLLLIKSGVLPTQIKINQLITINN